MERDNPYALEIEGMPSIMVDCDGTNTFSLTWPQMLNYTYK
jgi:hypothetical protein